MMIKEEEEMVSELYTNTTACTQDGFTVTSDK
jgi:hypothetical protein